MKIITAINTIVIICIVISLNFHLVYGQVQDTLLIAEDLPTTEILGSRLRSVKTPMLNARIITIDSNMISNSRSISIGDILLQNNQLFVASTENFSQDMRISIRGFGMRSAFGIRGVKLIVDGIPESTPDGQTDIENIDPNYIKSINVLKGSASGEYSNANGGVIEITTNLPQKKIEIDYNSTIGSFGLLKNYTSIGSNLGKVKLFGSYSDTRYNGYRDHNEFKTKNYLAKAFIGDAKNSLQLIYNGFTSPIANDPGGLTLVQAIDNRRQARSQNSSFLAGEKVEQNKISLQGRNKTIAEHSLKYSAFYTKKTFSNQLPFTNGGAVTFDRSFYGGQFSYTIPKLITSQDRIILGLEYEGQQDLRKRYDNLMGARGILRLNQSEEFSTRGLYLDYESQLNRLSLKVNGRIEKIRLYLSDGFLTDGDQSGAKNFMPASGKINAAYSLNKNLSISTLISTGFETPTLAEITTNPNSTEFNDLAPARTYTQEVGMSGKIKKAGLDVNIYNTTSSNELIPYQVASQIGRIFFRNGGQSVRRGIEINFNAGIYKSLNLNGSTNLNTFEVNPDVNNVSNLAFKIPGIPENQWQIGLNGSLIKHFNLSVNYQGFSSYYADDLNAVKIDRVNRLLFSASSNFTFNDFIISPSIGLNKIMSKNYFSNVFINAAGGRYYEPGALSMVYFSVGVGFGK